MSTDSQYLVTPGEESDVSVAICGGNQAERSGDLFFLTSHEAAVRYDPDQGVAFSVGQPVTVALSCDRLGDTIRIPGMVRFRRDEDHRRTFRVPFNFDGHDGSNLQRRLGKLNRRKEMRVPPVGPDEVRLALRPAVLGPDGELLESVHAWQSSSIELHDISFHGLSVMASFETDLVLADTQLVEIKMSFPSPMPEARVVGFLRNRVLDGSRIRYGVEVMGEHTQNYLQHEDAMAQYVWQRMRELFGVGANSQH